MTDRRKIERGVKRRIENTMMYSMLFFIVLCILYTLHKTVFYLIPFGGQYWEMQAITFGILSAVIIGLFVIVLNKFYDVIESEEK